MFVRTGECFHFLQQGDLNYNFIKLVETELFWLNYLRFFSSFKLFKTRQLIDLFKKLKENDEI